MNLRVSVRALVIVVALCGIAIGYLGLHSRNIKLTECEMELVKQRRILADEVESLELEVAQLAGFARTESLWVAQGRPKGERPGGLALGRR